MNKLLVQTLADSIKIDILKDPKLYRCRSFGELHEHCDANVLGDSEKLLDRYTTADAIRILNEAQTLVDKWLKERKVIA